MSSITYWNRLEPRPRSRSLLESLAARVRDPLWFLARQWQLGEFRGEDAGSPAFVRMAPRTVRLYGKRKGAVPLEALTQSEPMSPDLSLRVELGQTFERMLDPDGSRPNLRIPFLRDFALKAEDWSAQAEDPAVSGFLAVCAGVCLDGCLVYEAAKDGAHPTLASLAEEDRSAAGRALNLFRRWVADSLGEPSGRDPRAWVPEELDYRVRASATVPSGGRTILEARPGSDAPLDWTAFDSSEETRAESAKSARARRAPSAVPAHVRFPGMPAARWWDFESSEMNVADMSPDKPDLAQLAFMEFVLLYSNDWFVVPLEQRVGTLCEIGQLTVRDVFGGDTVIDRADSDFAEDGWTLFSTTGSDGTPAPYFFLPPAVGLSLPGAVLEEVGLLRDETADIAWAVERITPDAAGAPRPAADRAQTAVEAGASPAPPEARRYHIRSGVPENWFPLLPTRVAGPQTALRLGVLSTAGTIKPPAGRLLKPTGVDGFILAEDSLPRAGRRIQRRVMHARWIDGSTHVWTVRSGQSCPTEGASGLRFDLVE